MNTSPKTPVIVLRKNEDHRILAGHPWVFSNEIMEIHGSPAAGDVVEVRSAKQYPLGVGFYHPHSLIAVRLLSHTVEEITPEFLHRRITEALELRMLLFPGSTVYRLVHGESDFLPGLIVDRFNDFLSIQTLSYGMDARLPIICDALESMLHPRGIVERNESPLRVLEHLPVKRGILRGETSDVEIEEHGLRYRIDILGGQKTGFFLDQRENRLLARRFAGGKHVLDCFCNDGGFSLNSAFAGASSVLGLDISGDAVERATFNAHLNGLTNVRFEIADVFERLKEMTATGEKFDVIVLDPPSFTKSKKTVQAAKKGYRQLHGSAFGVLSPGGILITASCSHHITAETFLEIISETARKMNRRVQLLEWRAAAPDHPVIPAAPETRYLKLGVFRVL